MTTKKGGLGSGLGALFANTAPSEAANKTAEPEVKLADMPDGSYFKEIPVKKIKKNPKQPRQIFDEDELTELSESIKEVGLLQPIIVRAKKDGYELIMGERRLRAHQLAGIEKIPAIVRSTDDNDMLRDALLENLHRSQLNPLEEAAAYQQMLDDFGCTQDELAEKIKRSRPHISNTIRLLKLPPSVQRRVAAGILSAGHARALLVLDDPLACEQLAQRVVAEGMSVRATEEAVTLHRIAPQTQKKRVARYVPDSYLHKAEALADVLDTSVKVTVSTKKGRLTIDFADEEDLDRIISMIINK
uniref:ParB/RepB/Spo0J family partition protein n=1 Tax=Vaginimicrobium propionicum TaxID=1871034 RepID=UPI000970A80D|nr:ParB/RepB/Spo0J family partition protein [Vaginimicrobium propionicum]